MIKNKQFSTHKNHSKHLCLMIMMLCILLVTPVLVSAFEFDNIKLESDELDIWGYPEITIVNFFNIPLLRKDLSKIKLDYHQPQCLTNCNSKPQISLYESAILIEDIRFVDESGKEYNLEYDITLKDIEEYEIEVVDKTTEVCEDELNKDVLNITNVTKVCHNEYTYKNVTKEREVTNVYNIGEVKAIGSYKPNIHVTKPIKINIDYQIKVNGRWIEELAWWNSNWINKKEINITNPSGAIIEDYIIKLNISFNTNMQVDFSDLRFTNGSEDTELDYWLQSNINSNSVKAWVKLEKLENINTIIFMYYNNALASTTSNAVDTFGADINFDTEDNWVNVGADIDVHSNRINIYTQGDRDDYYYTNLSSNPINNFYSEVFMKWYANSTTAGRWISGFSLDVDDAHAIDNGIFWSWRREATGTFLNLLRREEDSQDATGGAIPGVVIGEYKIIFWQNGTTANVTIFNGTNYETVVASLQRVDIPIAWEYNYYYPINNYNEDVGARIVQGWTNETIFKSYILPTPTYLIGEEVTLNYLVVTLNTPTNNYNVSNASIIFNCSSTDETGVLNLTLLIDGEDNYTITNSSESQNLSIYYLETFSEGNHTWNCRADDEISSKTGTARDFNIDSIIPNIDGFLSPTTVLIPSENITINYTITDINLDSCLYQYNGVNTSLDCSGGSNNITNFTSVSPETEVVIYANDSFGNLNRSILSFVYDTTAPTITINLPTGELSFGYVGKAEDLNYSIIDLNLDSIWLDYNETNTSLVGAINSTTFNIDNSPYNLTIWANDTLNNINSTNTIWNYTIFRTAESYPVQALEGSDQTFYINVTNAQATLTPYLIYDGISYLGTFTSSGDSFYCLRDLEIPSVSAEINVTFYWSFLMADASIVNSSSHNVTVTDFGIDDCSANTIKILNISMKDEETNNLLNVSNLEVELEIYSLDDVLIGEFNQQWYGVNNVSICVENLTDVNYKMNMVSSFINDSYVNEFYFMDGQPINTSTTPINLSFMDLKSADSTSFLFNYFDVDGLQVIDPIIHTWRKYIGEGLFREVERSKQNDDGDTIVHLVEEDVIYYFQVSQNNTVIYTSQTYTALCDSSPCTISLEESGGFQDFETDWDLVDDGGYTLTASATTREVNLTFVTTTPSTFNLTVYKLDSVGEYESVGSDETTGTGGSVIVNVPEISGNVSFFAVVEQDEVYLKSHWIDMERKASEDFGTGLALFLGFLIVLCLGLMAISEGSGTIVFILLGMILTVILGLIDYRTTVGLGLIIYFIITGGIIIFKLTRKNR